MTDSGVPRPDGMRPDYLAAYVDGELAPEARAAIEAWLDAHPEALETLLAQRQFSPGNWPLWQQAEAPQPTADTWAAMRERIADACSGGTDIPVCPSQHRQAGMPVPPKHWKWLALAGSLAAALLVAWFAFRPAPAITDGKDVVRAVPTVDAPDDPLAEYAVLPIASAVEIDVQRVMGNPGGMFAVGEAPLDGPLVLATEDEVEVEGVEEHPAWPSGGPVTVPTPGDAPMIFAPRSR